MTVVQVPRARVALSTSSVYPQNCATAFDLAQRLGYDGLEVMVWNDPVSQEAGALKSLSDLHEMPIVSVHAPTLLLTQGIWGPEAWSKIDNSIELAGAVGADTVVLHPPFRWQKEYARAFADGVALREHDSGIRLAVENMFPWRARSRSVEAYLPHWDPVDQPYEHVTLDLSHAAIAGSDALAMAEALGSRLVHLHLADGLGSPRDEHLVPGRGGQPCAELLGALAMRQFSGSVVVEVSTRRVSDEQREADLAESLAFARLYLAVAAAPRT
jgi:sugar phosphate isomerase/epimerase